MLVGVGVREGNDGPRIDGIEGGRERKRVIGRKLTLFAWYIIK